MKIVKNLHDLRLLSNKYGLELINKSDYDYSINEKIKIKRTLVNIKTLLENYRFKNKDIPIKELDKIFNDYIKGEL